MCSSLSLGRVGGGEGAGADGFAVAPLEGGWTSVSSSGVDEVNGVSCWWYSRVEVGMRQEVGKV